MVVVALFFYVVLTFIVSTHGMLASAATFARSTATGLSYFGIGALLVQFTQAFSSIAQVVLPLANMVHLSLYPGTPAITAAASSGADILGIHGQCIACIFAGAMSFLGWKAT